MIEVSSTSFCSNPDALGFDESEKGIFDSLKNIARLPLDSPKEGGRMADSAAGTLGEQPIGEAGNESPAAGTGECLDVVDWSFRRTFVDVFCAFSDKQREDRPKSPAAAGMLTGSRWGRLSWRQRSRPWSRPVLPRGFWAVILLFPYVVSCTRVLFIELSSAPFLILPYFDKIWLSKSRSRPSSFGGLERVSS